MRKIKYLLVITFLMIISIPSANAATLTSNGTNKIYYSGNWYSYYNKKINGNVAYCIQLKKKVPAQGYKGYSSGWSRYTYDSYVSAQIIKLGKAKYSGETEYMNIQYALNCYKTYNGYYSGKCNNSAIKSLISSAKAEVKKYNYSSGKSTSSLPKLTLKTTSGSKQLKVLSGVKNSYVSEEITLSGMVDKYGGTSYSTQAQYKVTATSTVGTAYICTENKYSSTNCVAGSTGKTIKGKTSDKFYIIVQKGGTEGGKITLKVNGSNSSTYPASYLWKPSSTAYQRMVTTSSVKITRTRPAELSLHYVKADEYEASIEKVDENGEGLKGSTMTLYTSTDSKGATIKATLCTISGTDSSCSKKGLLESDGNGYITGNYLCYKETASPNGYKKVSDTICRPINLNATKNYYYNGDVSISKAEYDKYNGADKYCIKAEEGTEITDEYINTVIANGLTATNTNIALGTCDALAAINQKEICIDGQQNYSAPNSENKTYCDHDPLSYFNETDGSYSLTVTNVLNSVNISKKSITNKEEIPGAELAIYKTDGNGQCTNTLATAKEFTYADYTLGSSESDTENSENESDTETDGTTENNPSDDESTDNDTETGTTEEVDDNKDPAKDGLKWTSAYSEAIISGLAPGTYCLTEEIAPKGYKKVNSTVKFSIDDEGKTKLLDNGGANTSDLKTEDTKSTISIYNEPTELSISKTDIATGKELPGATLSICEAFENDKGKYEVAVGNIDECGAVSLADGSLATWTSTNKPHTIKGLGAGTYFLVEQVAPTNYSTAESILFTIKDDGKIYDANNKLISNNKIVMKDEKMKEVKTADLPIIGVFTICLACLSTAAICYYYSNKKYGLF